MLNVGCPCLNETSRKNLNAKRFIYHLVLQIVTMVIRVTNCAQVSLNACNVTLIDFSCSIFSYSILTA